jgi:hypothetical protein
MGLFGSNQMNPADVAMPYFKNIEQMQRGQFNPYAPEGMQDQGGLGQQYYGMGTDPTGHLNDLMGQYQESPGFRRQMEEAMKMARYGAAGSGMGGTESALMDQGALAGALQSQDMQQWLQNVMGVQNQGMQGQERQMGDLWNNMGTQGTLGFQGQQQKNSDRNSLWKAGLQGIGSLGGAFLGGPMGAMAGNKLGGWLGGNQGDTSGFAAQPMQGYGYNNPDYSNYRG